MNLLRDIVVEMCQPNEYLEDITKIDISSLCRSGIKLVLLDINNTILPTDSIQPSIRIIHWFEELRLSGLKVVLLSNQMKNARISHLAKTLKFPVYYFVCKPLPFVLKSIIETEYRLKLNQVALIGDQVISDVIVGNWLELHTILIKKCDHPLSTTKDISMMRHAKAAILEEVFHKRI